MSSETASAGPIQLANRFEVDLVQVLHGILGRVPLSQTLPIVSRQQNQSRALSAEAVRLVESSLNKGVVSLLVRGGGWHRERFLRGMSIAEGRLWQRTPPGELGLRFSKHTLQWLIWLVTAEPGHDNPLLGFEESSLTPADQFVIYLTFQAFEKTTLLAHFLQLGVVRNNKLVQLMMPEHLDPKSLASPDDWSIWLAGPGSWILEAWQPTIASRWVEMERAKGKIIRPERMQHLGECQKAVLESLTQAAETSGRRDLVRFLWLAAARLIDETATIQNWIGSLDVQGRRLADRMECYRAAGAMLYHFQQTSRWLSWAETLGYFDDEYQASQLVKGDWERLDGERLLERTRSLIRQLEPLPMESTRQAN